MQPPSCYSVSPLWSFCTTACGPQGAACGSQGVRPEPFFTTLRDIAASSGRKRAVSAGGANQHGSANLPTLDPAGTAAMKKPLDEPPKTWCGTCGCKFYGCGTNCPACREREERRKALAAGTGAAPAGEQSHGRRETSRTEGGHEVTLPWRRLRGASQLGRGERSGPHVRVLERLPPHVFSADLQPAAARPATASLII